MARIFRRRVNNLEVVIPKDEINNEEINNESLESNIINEPSEEIIEEDKTLCKIVVATPNYYTINKNDKLITIEETNSYKKGDTIIF